MKARIFLALATLLLGSALVGNALGFTGGGAAVAEGEPLVVFLVRHAEKTKVGRDPALTEEGAMRAEVLARSLRSADIDAVHSTGYVRTMSTAAPAATRLGTETEAYDPRDLPALAKKLRDAGGRHLVVGHSNTTPQMVELLGGDPGPAIDEAAEYDRLYIVTARADGSASSVLLRYGEAFEPSDDE